MVTVTPALVLAYSLAGGPVHLAGWEKSLAGADGLSANLELTRTNLIRQNKQTFTGSLAGMRPNLWQVKLADGRGVVTTYRGDGRSVFEYDGAAKQVTEFPVSPDPSARGRTAARTRAAAWRWLVGHPAFFLHREQFAAAATAVPLAFVATVTGEVLARLDVSSAGVAPLQLLSAAIRPGELARRFDATLTADDHYVYLRLVPRSSRDRGMAEAITLVLTRPDCPSAAYRLAHVQVTKNNGQETEDWKFTDVTLDPPGLTIAAFEFAPPPAGWTVHRATGP